MRVQGYCPMGCGETLTLGEGGFVVCGHLDCADPEAVTSILTDRESEHQVRFDPPGGGFTVRHPLRERVNDALLACELHSYCEDLPGPPVAHGLYRATWSEERARWEWEKIAA